MRHTAVEVIPEAKKDAVERVDGKLRVYTTQPAANGQANHAVVNLIQDFTASSGLVRIVSGHRQKNKIVEIPN